MSESGPVAPDRSNKFLVVVDDTPESKVALRFASRRASRVGGGVALLHVVEPPDFQHWMGVGEMMREEAREEAERLLQGLAGQAYEDTEIRPELIIREGQKDEELLKLIEEDPGIRILVLGASPDKGGPGPLVTSLAGEMSGSFRIPITVVPGTLTDEQIEQLT
ncbi:MAG: universal stress protein [Minwuiales bacterium]|nr:universal stress protein [Minwuiales bacterium]